MTSAAQAYREFVVKRWYACASLVIPYFTVTIQN